MLLRGLVTMLALRRCCLFCQMHGRLLATELAGDQDALSSNVRMVSQLPSASSSSGSLLFARALRAWVPSEHLAVGIVSVVGCEAYSVRACPRRPRREGPHPRRGPWGDPTRVVLRSRARRTWPSP